MLVQALRPATPELARRWLAALLIVPEPEREAVVEAVERQIVATYGIEKTARQEEADREVRVVSPPVQREGYVEHVETEYVVREPKPARKARGKAAG